MRGPGTTLLDRHAMFAPGLSNAFEMLRVSATIRERDHWRTIHFEPNLGAFEEEHGIVLERVKYNARSMDQARSKREPVLGRYAGLLDWFVPIVSRGHVLGVLVTGPFAAERPTSSDILARWRWLTGRQGHPADPEFAEYLEVTLSTLVLDGDRMAAFEGFLTGFARLIAGEGDAEKLLAEAEAQRDRAEEVRFVDRMWDAVRTMVDERTSHLWSSPSRVMWLKNMGMTRVADAALVGLLVSRERAPEPVEGRLRRDAFQRACVDLARSAGQVVSGRVGEHGVTLLSAATGATQRKEQRLLDLGERAAKVARGFALELHLGVSAGPTQSLSEHFQKALAAAESALSQGARVRRADALGARRGPSLGEVRRELAGLIDRQPAALPARFDRFLEVVAIHCGYRLEPARAHLEAAFERIEEALRDRRALGERSLGDAYEALERAAQEARTVEELFGAYRRAVSDVSEAAQRPVAARRDRSLRRALAYIHRHYSEPLQLEQVARVAGFAPNYFSALFKQREHVTFDHFLRGLRIERAKQLLVSTDLEARRVAELSGFATASYFARAFRRAVEMTPVAYRRSLRRLRASRV
jgi:AraC-like DNA-binding protein